MSRAKPKSLPEVKHFAKVSRDVVLRRMAPDQCFSSRVFWALVLFAWCGPEGTNDGMVVCKDEKGWIKRDDKGRPIPARQKHLIALLGVKGTLKGEVCRVLAKLNENGQIWTDEAGVMYVDPEPPAFEAAGLVASTRNWRIADRTVSEADLPPDPVASTASIQALEELSTAWKNDLKELRTRYRKLLVQAVLDGRIIIDKEAREVEKEESSSSAFSTVVEEPAVEQKADEEEAPPAPPSDPEPEPSEVVEAIPVEQEPPATWQTFSKMYPPDHLDGPKARPLFAALPPEKKRICINRLLVYLQSPRWLKSPQYIPLASNWLKSDYEEPPPPFYEKAASNGKKGFTDEVMEEARRRYQKWGEV